MKESLESVGNYNNFNSQLEIFPMNGAYFRIERVHVSIRKQEDDTIGCINREPLVTYFKH